MTLKTKSWMTPALRMFSSENTNYFKRVLVNEIPEKERGNTILKDIEMRRQYAEYHQEKAKEISKKNQHKEILGLRDYELQDFRIDGALNDAPDYKGIIQGKIYEDKIEANRYELEIVNHLRPKLELAVFDLPYNVKKEELLSIFEKHGVIDNLEIVNGINYLPSYAIVTYTSKESFESAINYPNEIWIRDRLLRIRSGEDSVAESISNILKYNKFYRK